MSPAIANLAHDPYAPCSKSLYFMVILSLYTFIYPIKYTFIYPIKYTFIYPIKYTFIYPIRDTFIYSIKEYIRQKQYNSTNNQVIYITLTNV